jgi:hypothetical protein
MPLIRLGFRFPRFAVVVRDFQNQPPESDSYQVSDNLTHVGDSRIDVGLIQRGQQLSEICYGRSYPASP